MDDPALIPQEDDSYIAVCSDVTAAALLARLMTATSGEQQAWRDVCASLAQVPVCVAIMMGAAAIVELGRHQRSTVDGVRGGRVEPSTAPVTAG
jgi:hypothetical protein